MAHVSPEVALAITRQKARYARYADTKQWDKFEALALPDAPYSFLDNAAQPLVLGVNTLVFDTASSIASFFSRFFADQDTMHNIGPGDFEQTGPDEVNSVFGFEDQIYSKALGSWAAIRGGGYYYETWKLVDGEWRIKSLRMERRYQEMTFLVKARIAIAGWLGTSLV